MQELENLLYKIKANTFETFNSLKSDTPKDVVLQIYEGLVEDTRKAHALVLELKLKEK